MGFIIIIKLYFLMHLFIDTLFIYLPFGHTGR